MFEAILSFIASYVISTKLTKDNSKKIKELPKIKATKKENLEFSLLLMTERVNEKIRNGQVGELERNIMTKKILLINELLKDKELFPGLERMRYNKSVELLKDFKKYL